MQKLPYSLLNIADIDLKLLTVHIRYLKQIPIDDYSKIIFEYICMGVHLPHPWGSCLLRAFVLDDEALWKVPAKWL